MREEKGKDPNTVRFGEHKPKENDFGGPKSKYWADQTNSLFLNDTGGHWFNWKTKSSFMEVMYVLKDTFFPFFVLT